jgi:DNA-directed RNA polymerase subunit beta
MGFKDEDWQSVFADVNTNPDHDYIKSTLDRDPAATYEESLIEVYKRIRPGDLATADSAKSFLDAMFTNFKRYDLGRVGRYKVNQRLGMDMKENRNNRVLRLDDLVAVVKEIIRLNNDPTAGPDDIDHLKNRRIRAVGESVQNRLRVGFLRMERIIKDRMSVLESEVVTPAQLINSRPVVAVLQEFFASSQLSQFMDQTNPLSELEHKRRIAATGPGGLSRERAGFEVRDVHNSHYGRICPIATPEGPNIGLVGQISSYARINEYGFLETPYRVVEQAKNGKPRVTDKIVYLDASEEELTVIAPASATITEDGHFVNTTEIVRTHGEPSVEEVTKIQYVDVSPKQIVSITTALIPFVEHDEAARSMMGSNMQRQAVPLIRPQSPVVGTGIEGEAARYSGQIIMAQEDGEITAADAEEIVVTGKSGDKKYRLQKFVRSNQGTSINQRPSVTVGQKVKKGDVIADSSATEEGELALGQNVLVAYMSFQGANYEDAIILSSRMVKDDRFTSVHIEKYTMEVRDTQLGPEVITRDIPNVGEEALSQLDEEGIVRIGALVSTGDILVGKITPKGETELSAEEKLLRAIFGEKAKDVKDTSLRLPHGERGKVIEVKIFSKDNGDELSTGVYQMVEVSIAQLRKISVGDKLAGRHGNKGVISKILPEEEMPFTPDGRPVDVILNPLGVISRMNLGQVLETHLGWAADKLGYKAATPVFEGVSFDQIKLELEKADLPVTGKIQLYDGRTGEPFDQETVIGINYIMKLIHLVDDKMHARSTGPYSMVTQQPLGGKAQFGGQRFGEMEVWALEAYGASHTLQEMLTIKSDDIIGRSKSYEAIIKGEAIQKPSIPASFYVLMRELQSLGLNIELITSTGEIVPAESEPRLNKVLPVAAGEDEEENEGEEVVVDEEEDAAVTELFSGQEENPPVAAEDEVME